MGIVDSLWIAAQALEMTAFQPTRNAPRSGLGERRFALLPERFEIDA